MYPFYNPQFVKLEHEGRIAQIPGEPRLARPSRRRTWLPQRRSSASPTL